MSKDPKSTNSLFLKSQVVKLGSSWRNAAQKRAHKQHGDSDTIPEGDIHAIIHHHNPANTSTTTPEEEKKKLDSLEETIRILKVQEEQKAAAQVKPKAMKDKLLGDWLKDE